MEAFSAHVTPKALTTMLIDPCLGQKSFIWGHSEGVLILQVDLPIRFHRGRQKKLFHQMNLLTLVRWPVLTF